MLQSTSTSNSSSTRSKYWLGIAAAVMYGLPTVFWSSAGGEQRADDRVPVPNHDSADELAKRVEREIASARTAREDERDKSGQSVTTYDAGNGIVLPAPLSDVRCDFAALNSQFKLVRVTHHAKGKFMTPDFRPRQVQEEVLVWTLEAKRRIGGLEMYWLSYPLELKAKFLRVEDGRETDAGAHPQGYHLAGDGRWMSAKTPGPALEKGDVVDFWTPLGPAGAQGIVANKANSAIVVASAPEPRAWAYFIVRMGELEEQVRQLTEQHRAVDGRGNFGSNNKSPEQREIKLFRLKNAKARDVLATLEKLLGPFDGETGVTAAVDERTNVIFVTGDSEVLLRIDAITRELDANVQTENTSDKRELK